MGLYHPFKVEMRDDILTNIVLTKSLFVAAQNVTQIM